MASRISDTPIETTFDRGIIIFPVGDSSATDLMPKIDLTEIMDQDNARELIQALPVQPLYIEIKSRSIEQCAEIIRALSDDQFVRMLDLDCWPENRLHPKRVMTWLSQHEITGPESMAVRLMEMDEEYQIAMLQGLVRTYDEEEVEKLPDEVRGNLQAMPCYKYFYEILTDDPEIQDFIRMMVDSALDSSIAYAYALLQYACYSVPNEPEFQLQQFRNSRLEEEGFVSEEEAAQLFTDLDFVTVKAKWHAKRKESPTTAAPAVMIATESFIKQVRQFAAQENLWSEDQKQTLEMQFLYLANALCAVARLDTDDVKSVNRVLDHSLSLVNIALDFVAEGDLAFAAKVLAEENLKTLFRVGASLMSLVRKQLLTTLEERGIHEARELLTLSQSRKFGSLLFEMDRKLLPKIGFELTETLKALCNRFPLRPDEVRSRDGKSAARIAFRSFHSLTDLNILLKVLKDALQVVDSRH
jgi:hypothetical protein